ncbi:Transcription initiation factor TFIID subunit 8, partial [Eschrichtius robustus]|nr:Transcription initiation factor TFIID subunit 8 [Eschrichtius robustus]
ISEIGRSAKSYCEHTARTQPTLSDIVVTLVEMGFNVDTLPAYAKRSQRMVITARLPRQTYREPVSDYQVLREKAASQRRDVERALTRFMAKTGETQSLFKDDVSTFPFCGILVPQPGIERGPPTVETWSPNHRTARDVPYLFFKIKEITGCLYADENDLDDSGAEKENTSVLQQNPSLSGSRNGEENIIDNPYLRPVKKPKLRRKK